MNGRRELLERLVNCENDLAEIVRSVRKFPWDSEIELVRIGPAHLCSVLYRFIKQHLSASDVEIWANAIESREDIGFEEKFEVLITDAIFELANPLLTQPLTEKRAQELVTELGCDAQH